MPGRTPPDNEVVAAATRDADDSHAESNVRDDITRVLVADDHPVVRMGAVALLSTEPGIEVVGESATCAACCDHAAELKPDIILLDLEMDDCRGSQALERLLEACPDAAVIVYSAHDRDWVVRDVIKAGASGFVSKGAPPTRLVDAVHAVRRGQCYLDPSVTSALMGARGQQRGAVQRNGESLTEREKAVLRLLAQGKRNKEISKALFISERTVKFHVSALMQKLGATNRTEAVKNAIDQGLIGT